MSLVRHYQQPCAWLLTVLLFSAGLGLLFARPPSAPCCTTTAAHACCCVAAGLCQCQNDASPLARLASLSACGGLQELPALLLALPPAMLPLTRVVVARATVVAALLPTAAGSPLSPLLTPQTPPPEAA